MSSSFDLPELESFAVGTVGPPGQRVFYLQAVTTSEVVTLRLEKQQVSILADYLGRISSAYELAAGTPTTMPGLHQPIIPEWTVGSMMVAIDEEESRVIVIAEELTDEDDEPDLDAPPSGGQARFALHRGQVEAFVAGAGAVIVGGRPTCPLCSRPIDPTGHFCPRMN